MSSLLKKRFFFLIRSKTRYFVQKEPPCQYATILLTFEEVNGQVVTVAKVCLAVDCEEQVDLSLRLELSGEFSCCDGVVGLHHGLVFVGLFRILNYSFCLNLHYKIALILL